MFEFDLGIGLAFLPMWGPTNVYRSTHLALTIGAVFLALLSALLVVHFGPIVPPPVVVAISVGIVILSVIAKYGAMVPVAGIIVLPLAGLNPVLMSFEGADIRASDALMPFVALAILALGRERGRSRQVTAPLGVLCAGVITSAVFVSRNDVAMLSALRFVLTMSLALLVIGVCRDSRDITFLLRVAGAAIMVGIGLAIAVGGATSVVTERFGQGLLGPNILGLVSAFLVLLGTTNAVYRRQSSRLVTVFLGVAGLVLAKSVGSTLALIAALTLIYGLRNREMRVGRVLVAFTLLFAVTVVFVATFRPTSLPWSEDFSINSGQQRIIGAYAGLHVFLQHPFVGVGWGGSATAIAAPAVSGIVRQAIVSANPLLYPDIQAAGVTNAYIQLLAELGLIGGVLLLWLIRNCFRACRVAVRAGHALAPFLAGSLLLFAVWWNETALFGGQPETFLFAVVLGTLSIARSDGFEEPPVADTERRQPHVVRSGSRVSGQ